MNTNLELKLEEDLSFYEIEMTSEGEIEITPEIEEKNNKFMKEVFEPQILSTVSVCPCRMPEFMERNMRRAKLLNIPPQQVQPTIEQEDVDSLKYGVVILSNKGVYTGVSAIVQECRKCHKINYWGNADVFSRMIAEVTTNYFSNIEINEAEPTEETPHTEDGNNLIDASKLFGEGTYLENLDEQKDETPDEEEAMESSEFSTEVVEDPEDNE